MRAFCSASFLALVLSASTASAHGIWLAERCGETAIVFGHGAEDSPYDPASVERVEAVGRDGTTVKAEVRAERNHVVVVGDADALVADFDGGFHSRGADGKWVAKTRVEVPGATDAVRAFKYAIHLTESHTGLPRLPPQTLQIIPLSDPGHLPAGSKIRVRVIFQGRPLGGLFLIPDFVNAAQTTGPLTDFAGEAEVTLRNNGLNVIAAAYSVPLVGDPRAVRTSHFATLSFVSGPHHDD